MQNLQFPLELSFKVTTLSNDFTARDANGRVVSFVKQKLFRFIEEVSVYSDESKAEELYTIRANQWLDFSAAYTFTNKAGADIGRIARKGWASLWKARYEIYDGSQATDLLIQEENGWIKVADAVLGEIPVLNFFTGYFLNPSYLVTRPDGTAVVRLKKERSFWGRRFSVTKLGEFEPGEEERVLLGLMMMILLERRRG